MKRNNMYTKGEWKVRQHGITRQIYVETPTRPKAKEYQIAEGIYNKANAQLIASAPDLYAALKALYNSDPDMSVVLVNQVQEALAKAEGNVL